MNIFVKSFLYNIEKAAAGPVVFVTRFLKNYPLAYASPKKLDKLFKNHYKEHIKHLGVGAPKTLSDFVKTLEPEFQKAFKLNKGIIFVNPEISMSNLSKRVMMRHELVHDFQRNKKMPIFFREYFAHKYAIKKLKNSPEFKKLPLVTRSPFIQAIGHPGAFGQFALGTAVPTATIGGLIYKKQMNKKADDTVSDRGCACETGNRGVEPPTDYNRDAKVNEELVNVLVGAVQPLPKYHNEMSRQVSDLLKNLRDREQKNPDDN